MTQHEGLDFTLQFAARWVAPLMAFRGDPDNELIPFDIPAWGIHAVREADGGVALYAGDRTAFIVIRDENTRMTGDLPEGKSLDLYLPDTLVQACRTEPVQMRDVNGSLAEFDPPGWMTPKHVLVMAFGITGRFEDVTHVVFGDGPPPDVTEEEQDQWGYALAKGRDGQASLNPTWLPIYQRILDAHTETPVGGMFMQTAYLERLRTVDWTARLSFSDPMGPVVVTWPEASEATAVLMPMLDPTTEEGPPEPWLGYIDNPGDPE